jgi:hypothetical protein
MNFFLRNFKQRLDAWLDVQVRLYISIFSCLHMYILVHLVDIVHIVST